MLGCVSHIMSDELDCQAGLPSSEEWVKRMNEAKSQAASEIAKELQYQVEIEDVAPFEGSIGQEFLRLSSGAIKDRLDRAFASLEKYLEKKSSIDVGTLYYSSALIELFVDLPNIVDFVKLKLEEEEEEDHVPEHIAQHDFEQYGDNDWFSHEYELNTNLQDVLLGPEHAELDDVSDPAPAKEDCGCVLCGDAEVEMRTVKVCRHEFCAECLETQLNTEHECRYKCSLCKAEFFPRDTTA